MIRILKESETKREAIFAREDPVGSAIRKNLTAWTSRP